MCDDDTVKGHDLNNLIDFTTGTRDPLEESSDDKGEHKEVFTLGRISTRS